MKALKPFLAFSLALLAANQAEAKEQIYKYVSDFETTLIINLIDKEVVIQDAMLEIDFCGKNCISAGNLSLAAVEGREAKTLGALEFRPRNGVWQGLLGFHCELIGVFEGGVYVGEYCYSSDLGVLAFRMNKLESGRWFYLQQARGVFSKSR